MLHDRVLRAVLHEVPLGRVFSLANRWKIRLGSHRRNDFQFRLQSTVSHASRLCFRAKGSTDRVEINLHLVN
jgi:hypothetical protein